MEKLNKMTNALREWSTKHFYLYWYMIEKKKFEKKKKKDLRF